MTDAHHAARQRATLLLAAASAAGFALGLIRTKALAMAWGPTGIGQMGLLQAAMGTAGLVTGLGVDGLVARDVAMTRSAPGEASRVFAVATTGAAALAVIAGGISFAGLALYLHGLGIDSLVAALVLATGVGASVLGANVRALLTGLGASRDVATMGVLGAGLALALSLGVALLRPDAPAVALAVITVPLGAGAVGTFLARKRAPTGRVPPLRALADVLRVARRATVFTAAGVLPLLGQSMVRTLVAAELPAEQLGQMQAAAAISAISTSLLVSSIGPVVVPQLSALVAARGDFSGLLGEHVLFLVRLFAPVAIAIAGAPALVLTVLYSSGFSAGAGQLAWQLVGEVLRLPVWLTATTLVVLARGRAYFLVEAAGLLVQGVGLWLVLSRHELWLIGVVYAASALVQLVLATSLLRADGFRWTRRAVAAVSALSAVCAALALLVGWSWTMLLAASLFAPAALMAGRLILALRSGVRPGAEPGGPH